MNGENNKRDSLAMKMQEELLKKQHKNALQNDILNDSQNNSLNEDKMYLNDLESDINENDVFIDELVNEALNEPLNKEDNTFDIEGEEDSDQEPSDDIQGSIVDDPPVIETLEDPLDNYIQEPSENEPIEGKVNPVEEIKRVTGDSPKNLQNLSKLGEIVLDMADMWKAQLCSAYSGQSAAEYTSDSAAKKALIEAFKEYLNSQEIKAPTPFGTLMIALALWGLPSIGTAVWHKYQLNQEDKKKVSQPEPIPDNGEAVTDYTHTKEYKENRRLFTIHKTKGTYNRTSSGTFSQINVSDEYPSSEIQILITEGKKCPEIRSIIYGE